MSKYFSRIYREIWDDSEFYSMSETGKLCFLYLCSCPIGSQFGIFRAGKGALADHFRMEQKGFQKGFREVLAKGLVEYSDEDLLLLIPSYVRRNPPNNPNVLKGWGRSWEQLPDCDLKAKSWIVLDEQFQALGKAFREAFAKSFTKPSESLLESIPESPFEHTVQGSRFKVQGSIPPIVPNGDRWRKKDFEEFHRAYHSQGKARGPAEKAWKKAHKEKRLPEQCVLMESLRNHLGSKRWSEGHVLGEAVFINQSRWEQKLEQVGGEGSGMSAWERELREDGIITDE